MDQAKRVLDFCTRHQTVLGYSVVSLLTALTEYIFSSVVFKCPCNSDNAVYGIIFLLVPALIFFLLGCISNVSIWRMVTGCQPADCCSRCCYVMTPTMSRALVAPVTWIAVALLGGSFYECAASGLSLLSNYLCTDKGKMCPSQVATMPCNRTLSKQVTGGSLSLQAQSQLIGWFLILIIMIVGVISTCVSHCCSPVSYMQLKFWKIYLKKENELFVTKAKEHSAKLAERNINCFFHLPDPTPADQTPFQTPSNEDWRKISLLYTFNPQEQHYSMMHEFVNTNRGSSAKFREGDQNSFILGFVNDVGLSESGI
ncbi:calcium homeostasis modulator protein 6 [Indicator indicator]|uniref:calcium homeostasis modulator protein 6 n=1 Tax=Indicator indicator TaxID=1002788 RepID=UPI0023DF7CB5|nr:calcium homeostasis modulator protein 6 [Indicator indicator]